MVELPGAALAWGLMPHVAIITRTQNRPYFLRRALASVAGQTYRDFHWVIVNDAGEPGPVDDVVQAAQEQGLSAEALHRPESTGMEAASNHGIRHSSSTYLAIHDDDDSWKPEFLAKMVAVLDQNPAFVGAVSGREKVEEKQVGDEWVTVKTKQKCPPMVTLLEVLFCNAFQPIALLYRREVHEQIGYFDESFPVCGDWDFHLRLLQHGDLFTLPEPLARHHSRPVSGEAGLANSLAQQNLVNQHRARILNRLLRTSCGTGDGVISYLMERKAKEGGWVPREKKSSRWRA